MSLDTRMVQPPDFPKGDPVRIVSDLHLGHHGSAIRQASDLRELLEGASVVVFNGDTFERRYAPELSQAEFDEAALREECVKAGVEPVFLNGNHDPDLSQRNHLDLAGGQVLVMHGDLLFHGISPWSKEALTLQTALDRELARAELNDPGTEFEKRLQIWKNAALELRSHPPCSPRGPLAKLIVYKRALWPPWRPLRIVRCWLDTPQAAVDLARKYRPNARFIVIGHTHFSGVWKRDSRTVINTGSLMPSGGRRLVDLTGTTLTVRRIIKKNGSFIPGGIVLETTVGNL